MTLVYAQADEGRLRGSIVRVAVSPARLEALRSRPVEDEIKRALEAAARQRQERDDAVLKGVQRQAALRAIRVCANYGSPNGGAWWEDIKNPDSPLLRDERMCQNLAWPAGNKEFCESWIQKCWVPSVQPVLDAFGVGRIEECPTDPPRAVITTAAKAEIEHARIAIGLAKTLYVCLLNGQESRIVTRELTKIRKQLGPGRHQMAFWFQGLGRCLTRPKQQVGRLAGPALTFGGAANDPKAGLQPEAATVRVSHADDFTWLVVGEQQFNFKKGQQAAVIKTLFETWKKAGDRDGCGLSEEVLEESARAAGSSFRMQKLFRGHPAKDTILSRPSKGVWALFLKNPRKKDTSVDS